MKCRKDQVDTASLKHYLQTCISCYCRPTVVPLTPPTATPLAKGMCTESWNRYACVSGSSSSRSSYYRQHTNPKRSPHDIPEIHQDGQTHMENTFLPHDVVAAQDSMQPAAILNALVGSVSRPYASAEHQRERHEIPSLHTDSNEPTAFDINYGYCSSADSPIEHQSTADTFGWAPHSVPITSSRASDPGESHADSSSSTICQQSSGSYSRDISHTGAACQLKDPDEHHLQHDKSRPALQRMAKNIAARCRKLQGKPKTSSNQQQRQKKPACGIKGHMGRLLGLFCLRNMPQGT